MSKLDSAAMKNRAEQLNPLSPKYLSSRSGSLRNDDVKVVQRAEVKSSGYQKKGGLGAQAQKQISKK